MKAVLSLLALYILSIASVTLADVRLRDGESVLVGGARISCGAGREYLPSDCRDAFTGVEENFRRCVSGTSDPVGKTNCRFQVLEPFMKEHKECVNIVGANCYDLCVTVTPGGKSPQFWCRDYCGLPL